MLIPNISNSSQAAPIYGHIVGDAPKAAASIPPEGGTPVISQSSPEQLKSAVDIINHAMQQSHQNLEFSVDSSTKTPVVKMTDSTTGQVISQFPTEAALAIAHSIDQMQPGLLLKQKA